VIEHVSFTVSPADAVACAGFYELLGFARVEPPAGLGDRSIWLSCGGSSLHLVFRDRDQADLATPPPRDDGGHVALVVESFDATIAALGAAGVVVEPRTAYWGAARALVRDPAGNLIELMAAAPVVR
jgi:catechol 2,3-dioxygenase-like lactoylglutathione lyase family enzyme